MALIKCPECGHEISDRAESCPHCGCPVQKNQSITKKKVLQSQIISEDIVKKKKRKMFSIAIIAIVLLVILVALYFAIYRNKHIFVEQMEISKWKLVESGEYLEEYEGKVTADEKNPFVAIIGYYEDIDDDPKMVYMENGEGIIHTYETDDDDPSIEYKPIGYLSGKPLSEKDVSEVSYKDSDYKDYESMNETTCNVTIDMKLKDKKSGIVLFELKNDLNNEIEYNCFAIVKNGTCQYTYYLEGLPLKSRGVEVSLIPKIFCESEVVSASDYSVEKPFTVKKDEGKYSTSFSGEVSMSFDGYLDGFVLYTEELIDGGDKEDRGQIKRRKTYLHDNTCTMSTLYYPDDESITPKYSIVVFGYLPWNTLEEK